PPAAKLKLTAETYWRPSGKNIHRDPRTAKETDEWGVKPDAGLEVPPLTLEERARWIRHFTEKNNVAGKPGVAPPPPKEPKEPKKDDKPFEDRALLKALDVVKKKLAGTAWQREQPPVVERGRA